MQKSILVLFFIMATLSSTAQLMPAKKSLGHAITDSVAAAVCSCVMNSKDSLTTLHLFYAALDDCLKTNSGPRIDALLQEDGYVNSGDRKSRAEAIRAVGRKLGQQVARECAGFKELLDSVTAKENKPELH